MVVLRFPARESRSLHEPRNRSHTMPTRRQFLHSAAAVPLGAPIAFAADRVPVIDTHLHCFAGATSTKYPYHPNGPYRPASRPHPSTFWRA